MPPLSHRGRDEALAQVCLLELARCGSGDLVDELEALRKLPFRELLAEVLAELVRTRFLPLAQDDHRQWPLSPLLVWHRDHRRLGDRRMSHQEILHVHRGDPLAARLDEVLGAIGYPAAAA